MVVFRIMSTIPGPLSDGTAAFPYPPPRTGPLGELIHENMVYSCEAGYRPLFLDLRVPRHAAGPQPLIVWIHGGGWVFGSRRRLPPNLFHNRLHDRMLEAGYAVAAVDYRFAREAPLPGILLDLKAAIRWLRGHASEFNVDPERVVVWGESAGGHLAAMLGICPKLDGAPRTGEYLDQSEQPQAVVDWYGPADLASMAERRTAPTNSEEAGNIDEHPLQILKRGTAWTYAEMSPITYARADLPPIFVAHGTDDQQVPVDQSRRLVTALQDANATVEYLEVPGADHVWVGAPSVPEVVDRSLDFLNRHLPPAASSPARALSSRAQEPVHSTAAPRA